MDGWSSFVVISSERRLVFLFCFSVEQLVGTYGLGLLGLDQPSSCLVLREVHSPNPSTSKVYLRNFSLTHCHNSLSFLPLLHTHCNSDVMHFAVRNALARPCRRELIHHGYYALADRCSRPPAISTMCLPTPPPIWPSPQCTLVCQLYSFNYTITNRWFHT